MSELELHDPFEIPDPFELEHQVRRPKWWYAQQMRIAGASWAQIAEALGYASDKSCEEHTVRKSGWRDKKRKAEDIEELRELELDRLDMLQLVQWRAARQGDPKATDLIIRIMAERRKYMPGLEVARTDHNEGGNVTNNAIFIGGSEQEYMAALKQAREAVSAQQVQVIEGSAE